MRTANRGESLGLVGENGALLIVRPRLEPNADPESRARDRMRVINGTFAKEMRVHRLCAVLHPWDQKSGARTVARMHGFTSTFRRAHRATAAAAAAIKACLRVTFALGAPVLWGIWMGIESRDD